MEPRRSEPLLDLRFFRSPPFAGANTIALAMSASLGGFLFLNTLYLQEPGDGDRHDVGDRAVIRLGDRCRGAGCSSALEV